MLGKTHAVVGIAATLIATTPKTMPELVLAVGLGSLGALISDIDVDHGGSHDDANRVISLAVVVVLLTLALDYFADLNIVVRILATEGVIRPLAGIFIFLATCAFGKDRPHRSFMHSFLGLAILEGAIYLIYPNACRYFAVGFISHLATDALNFKKLRLLYPLKWGVSLGLFHAKGRANDLLFFAGSVASIVLVVVMAYDIIRNGVVY